MAIYSLCTPDDGWDCHPKRVELAIAKNKNAIFASCWAYLLLLTSVLIFSKHQKFPTRRLLERKSLLSRSTLFESMPGLYELSQVCLTGDCRVYVWSRSTRGRDSSVGIATGYGLGSPGIEARWQAKFSAPVQTGPGAHPASCTMGTVSFPGVKSDRGMTLTPLPPSSAVVMKG